MLKTFRFIALAEGISYLLFAITMPLKYVYGITEPNFFVGLAHGILFMLYVAFWLRCTFFYRWQLGFSALVFVASLVPFGTFFIDARYLSKQT